MTNRNTSYRFGLVFLALAIFIAGVFAGNLLDIGRPVGKSVEQKRISEAYDLLRKRYVEEIDSNELSEGAIEGMLGQLDPHSRFIAASDVREVQEDLEGEFGGIGIWYQVINDTARISSVMPNAPSEAAGLLPGDRIIGVNDSTVTGDASNTLQYLIKGPTDTDVSIRVFRPSVDAEMDFEITRKRIPIFSIDGAHMLDDRTGYIKVGRFSVNTFAEFEKHLEVLVASGMNRLILDLRDNPGGILEEAVKMVDEFLGGEQRIVETRGRIEQNNNVSKSKPGDSFEQQPLIVIVNENSASASEIVAGALQDNDRALIIGERTFGKALVQQQYQLSDGSLLHMTVSRYFTPTGRLIQTDYSSANRDDYLARKFVDSDSSNLRFSTVHGRDVIGGGGIHPDIVLDNFSGFALADTLIIDLRYRNKIQSFVRSWIDRIDESVVLAWRKDPDATANDFRIPSSEMNAFWNIVAVDSAFAKYSRADFARVEPTVRLLLRATMAQRLAGSNASNKIYNQLDPYVIVAQENWPEAEQLTRYHKNSPD